MNRKLFSLTLFCLLVPVHLLASATGADTAADGGVIVSEGTLDEYVGTYVIAPDIALRVWREGDRLMVQATGQEAWPLLADSETVFHVRSLETKITFGVNAEGKSDHLVLLMDGREAKAIRK